MDFSKYTELAQQAIVSAQSAATERSHGVLTPLHILKGVLAQAQGLPRQLLKEQGVDLATLEADVDDKLDGLPKVSGGRLAADQRFRP
jgi:ATP-dependent Clp protease ATP-binding subunit ClpB